MQGILLSPADLNEPVDPNDRFAYGWRYIKKVGKNGAEKTVQVPLTLEDILHPQEEDFRVLNDPHWQDMFYLYGALKTVLRDTPGAYVLGDCRVAWDRKGKYGHGPDIAVVFNVKEYGAWTTFNVVKEKTKPALIVEVTSPSTRSTDLVDKVREYAEQGVPHFVIADAEEKEDSRRISLIDYHLPPDGRTYFSLPTSEDGRVWLPEVNLWLGSEEGVLVCHDEKGNRVKTVVEEHVARVEAETRAASEKEKREALEARIQELEEKMRRTSHSRGRNGTEGK